nr:hypothetical protein [Bacillus toyonensis]
MKEEEDYYEKNRFRKLLLCFTALLVLPACQKYNGDLQQWGSTVDTVDTAKLKRNNILYEIRDGKVYIPEDAFSDATYCCT